MYLTGLKLEHTDRQGLSFPEAPGQLYEALNTLVPAGASRLLWRSDVRDNCLRLTLLSETAPDLTPLLEKYGAAPGEISLSCRDQEDLFARIAASSTWSFRLRANPTYSLPDREGRQRGKLRAHSAAAAQKQWLRDRGQTLGFRVERCIVSKSRWYSFRRRDGRRVQFLSVDFRGQLTVTDPERFRETLRRGIGREKAYGMGLLLISPAGTGACGPGQ